MKKHRHSFLELYLNSLCLFLICGVPGPCSNDFFHTALIIKFIHFPSCTIPLNKKLWVIRPLTLKVQRRKGHIGLSVEGSRAHRAGHRSRRKGTCMGFSGIRGFFIHRRVTRGVWFSETGKHEFSPLFVHKTCNLSPCVLRRFLVHNVY